MTPHRYETRPARQEYCLSCNMDPTDPGFLAVHPAEPSPVSFSSLPRCAQEMTAEPAATNAVLALRSRIGTESSARRVSCDLFEASSALSPACTFCLFG